MTALHNLPRLNPGIGGLPTSRTSQRQTRQDLSARVRSELSPRQMLAMGALLAGGTLAHAASSSGVSQRTVARWLDQPAFVQKLQAATDQLIDDVVARVRFRALRAADTLTSLHQDPNVRPCDRIAAARTLLDFAFRTREVPDVGPKP